MSGATPIQIAAAILLAAIARPDARGPAVGGVGRAMLDPIRDSALHPDELVARLALDPAATVADVGAGPGFLTLPLARAVPRGRVVATDISADLLAVARERALRAGVDNVETRLVARDDPGLAPSEIDLALLCQVDHYLPDRARYFAALAAALKPGGRIALVNFRRWREPDLAAARAASLRVVDEWSPSPPFFALVLAPGGDR